MPSTAWARIDLTALQHNYRLLKRLAPGVQVFASVKSDAYGHGLPRIATALPHADGFALVQLDDARTLREHGLRQPILLMQGVLDQDELTLAAKLNAQIAVCNEHQLQLIRAAAFRSALPVWVKVNTGMNRFGFRPEHVHNVLALLRRHPAVRIEGLMSHFHSADNMDSDLGAQWKTFKALVDSTGLPFSMANSAATLRNAETHGQLVRAGSLLYGNNPFLQELSAHYGFRPVMRFEASIISVSSLAPGDAYGYNASFVADRPTRIGIVGCGYGDGYPYTALTGTPVLVRGQRTRTLGRPAMNVMAIDLTSLPEVQIGDTVTLWGDPALPISDVAQASGIVSEALECGLTKRVPVSVIGHQQPEPYEPVTAPPFRARVRSGSAAA